ETRRTNRYLGAAYLLLDRDGGCLAARFRGRPRRAAGTGRGSRTHPHRRDRRQLQHRVEGQLPHRGRGLRLRRSQDPQDPSHLRIPNAEAGTRCQRPLKFQICLARFPITEPILDDAVAASPYFSLLSNSEDGSWTGWTRIEGEEHLVSARRVEGWPLIVSVSLPEREVYSLAWTRLQWRSAAVGVTILALTMLTVLSARQARREAALRGELEHRVKNTLAVVATVIERAREDTKSIDEFLSSLRARIQSMASTQALLSQRPGRGVSVADLVRTELRPLAA